jgi:hypothetical protein
MWPLYNQAMILIWGVRAGRWGGEDEWRRGVVERRGEVARGGGEGRLFLCQHLF